MNMYTVYPSKDVDKFLDKLDAHIRVRLEEKLKTLGITPIPSDSKFIERDVFGDKIFRYRIGDYRALYKVKDSEQAVIIIKVDKRPRIYDR